MAGPDIAGLVGARICHDLISPIGAISNGVELLTLTETAVTPELQLINDSVAGASAKVKFLRVAFGYASAEQTMGPAEIRTILKEAEAGRRLRYDWTLEEAATRSEVRCAFLGLLCLQSAMPMGGTVTIQSSGGVWTLFGQTETLKMESGLWSALVGQGAFDDLSPSDVHFALLPHAARDLGRRVHAAQRTDGLVVTF